MAVASSVHVFLSIGNRHFLWEEDELRMSTIYLEDRNIYMYTFIVKVYNYKKVILVRNLHSSNLHTIILSRRRENNSSKKSY